MADSPAPDFPARDFRAAVEAKDVEAIIACLHPDVVFRSPVAHKPYAGKAITSAILANVVEVFADFRYVRELADEAGHALVFEATVAGLDITGCDFLVVDEDGLVTDLMVMLRPLKATQALAEAMAARFPAIVELAASYDVAG